MVLKPVMTITGCPDFPLRGDCAAMPDEVYGSGIRRRPLRPSPKLAIGWKFEAGF